MDGVTLLHEHDVVSRAVQTSSDHYLVTTRVHKAENVRSPVHKPSLQAGVRRVSGMSLAVWVCTGRGGRCRYGLGRVIPVFSTFLLIENPSLRRCSAYRSLSGSTTGSAHPFPLGFGHCPGMSCALDGVGAFHPSVRTVRGSPPPVGSSDHSGWRNQP